MRFLTFSDKGQRLAQSCLTVSGKMKRALHQALFLSSILERDAFNNILLCMTTGHRESEMIYKWQMIGSSSKISISYQVFNWGCIFLRCIFLNSYSFLWWKTFIIEQTDPSRQPQGERKTWQIRRKEWKGTLQGSWVALKPPAFLKVGVTNWLVHLI